MGERSDEEAAVKALKVAEEEDAVKVLLGETGTPIPGRGETTVDAGAAVISRAVETVAEKITQNVETKSFNTSIFFLDEMTEERIGSCLLADAADGSDDGRKNSWYLSVFVDKDEGIRDVTITEMNDAEANPLSSHSTLDDRKDCGHGAGDTRSGLNSVETLTRVCQMISV